MKKIFGFCLVFLLFFAASGFSQNSIAASQELRVLSFEANGNDYAPNIISATLNRYRDNTYQLCIYYRGNTPAEFFYFNNPRRGSTGYTEYDVSIQVSGGDSAFGFMGTIIPSAGNLTGINIYSGNQRVAYVLLRE